MGAGCSSGLYEILASFFWLRLCFLPCHFNDTNEIFINLPGNLKNSALNRLTIAVNNTLSVTTSPQGKVDEATGRLKPDFDFFNYAGIHRSVRLYAVPSIHITDVTVVTSTIEESGSARLRFSFVYDERKEQFQQNNLSSKDVVSCSLEVIDAEQQEVARINACSGSLLIDNPHLWWPVGMAEKPGYQYTGRFVLSNGSEVVDVYYQKFGLRTIQVAEKFLLINGKNIYIRGFGRHEDSSIRGRGLDIPLIVKDNYLMHWIGANSFRTSHYPYSEELMSLADEEGFMVIDECPAVGLHDFNDDLYDQHAASIKELIQRDKNRPSVIAWSVANEPKSQDKRADNYFKRIVSLAKSLDNSRPITAATHSDVEKDLVTQHLDFLMINLYYGWYSNPGSTEVIKKKIIHDVTKWVNKHQKPVMMSEYGADTIAGIHSLPSFVFSEDYQAELVVQHFIAFDELRSKGLLFGEMIWNFADFMTDQTINRVFGNKKGIFTRDRQPKLSARLLRCRYHQLGNLTVSEDDFMLCPANTRS